MKAVTFTLSGRTAFFKKPDVNSYAYFTYNNIHKVALLGLLGAVIGLKGYNQQNNDSYPEFYKKLHNLKISIVPLAPKGYFSKKIQIFNNTTGFYNKDSKNLPCSLNIREQWLHNVSWQIFILEDTGADSLFPKLKEYLLDGKCEYIPYLGKNDHPATINNVAVVDMVKPGDIKYIDSLFRNNDAKISDTSCSDCYEFRENLPIGLDKINNHYIMDEFIFTNRDIKDFGDEALFYKGSGYNLCFF